MNRSSDHHVEVPAEAIQLGVDAAHRQLGEPAEDAMELVVIRQRVEEVIQAAAPSIRAPLEAEIQGLRDDLESYRKERTTFSDRLQRLAVERDQAAQQERERIEAALKSKRAKAEAHVGSPSETINLRARHAVEALDAALATLKEEDHG